MIYKINNKSLMPRPKQRIKITNKEFVEILKLDKKSLKKYLNKELKKYYSEVKNENGFLYAKGDNIALTAHMDTTPTVEYGNRKPVKDVYEYVEDEKHIMYSPQGIGGDDRCGVYMILKILRTTDLRPTIIFCEDEEIGCVGSDKFTKTKYIDDLKEMYFIIQLDRRGSNDLVFYDDENEEFHSYCEEITGYREAIGSCSDISNLCPVCGVSGVNISCGYYNEHHDYETVNLDEMENTFEITKKLIIDGLNKKEQYEYIERVYQRYNFGYDGYYKRLYRYNYEDDYDDRILGKTYNERKLNEAKETYYLEIEFDNGIDYGFDSIQESSIADCWYAFFSSHPTIRMSDVTDYAEYSDSDLVNISV